MGLGWLITVRRPPIKKQSHSRMIGSSGSIECAEGFFGVNARNYPTCHECDANYFPAANVTEAYQSSPQPRAER